MTTPTPAESIKEQLQYLHQQLVEGRSMDAKTLRFWTNAIIKGDKTEGDFVATCVTTAECQRSVLGVLRDVLFDKLGSDALEPEVGASYCAAFVDAVCQRRVCTDRADVERWATQLPAYQDKVYAMVGQIYRILHDGAECPAAVCEHYLAKFRTVAGYDTDALQRDIGSGEAVAMATAPSEASQPPSDIAAAAAVTTAVAATPAPNLALLQAFEDIMGRPMFVHEYLKYVGLAAGALPSLCQQQRATYHKLAEIHKLYLNQALDEYSFVKMHLDKTDDPERAVAAFQDAILYSEAYETQMKLTIKRRYQEVYDEVLDDEDLKYVFRCKVQAKNIHLFDESISSILVAFKQETDDIISHIFNVYMDTLGRQPDLHESTKWIRSHRVGLTQQDSASMAALDAELERALMLSLEYHDILKAKIKACKPDILPSQLFETLSRCIQDIGQCASARDVEAFIQARLVTV